jgi:hypothetical protein
MLLCTGGGGTSMQTSSSTETTHDMCRVENGRTKSRIYPNRIRILPARIRIVGKNGIEIRMRDIKYESGTNSVWALSRPISRIPYNVGIYRKYKSE